MSKNKIEFKPADKIQEIGAQLGYNIDEEGFCHGFTLKWLCAILIGEEDKFNQRIKLILSDEHLLEHIKNIQEKTARKETLSVEEQRYIEILYFYEGLTLFQDSEQYPELVSQNQLDFEFTSLLAGSDTIAELGGLKTIYSEISQYTKENLETYLNHLENMIETLHTEASYPFGFHLQNAFHAIGLSYDKKTHNWHFKNLVDQDTILEDKNLTTSEIAEKIFDGLKKYPSDADVGEAMANLVSFVHNQSKNERSTTITKGHRSVTFSYLKKEAKYRVNDKLLDYEDAKTEISALFLPSTNVTFLTTIITTKKIEENFKLTEQLMHMQKPQVSIHNEELMQDIYDLAWVAASNGKEDFLLSLIHQGINVNQLCSEHGVRVAHLAAKFGLMQVLEFLEKNNADFNSGDNTGWTPLMAAVEDNRSTSVNWLLTKPIDINAKRTGDHTACHFAVQYAKAEVIHALARHAANFNLKTEEGYTSVYIAAENANLDALAAISQHRNIDLNIPDNQGKTPLFIATEMGHNDIVLFLLEHGQSEKIPFVSSLEYLVNYFTQSIDVMVRMDGIIKQKLAQGCDSSKISLLPEDIAFVMGHENIAAAIKKHQITSQKTTDADSDLSILSIFSNDAPSINPSLNNKKTEPGKKSGHEKT